LLFIAGTLAQLALMQPLITFLGDELQWSHRKSVLMTSTLVFVGAHVPIVGLQSGALDEIDFWAGTFGITLFALVETVLFVWLFRPERAWQEIHRGAKVRIPRVFLWLPTYVTPLYLLGLCLAWAIQYSPAVFSMAGVSPEDVPWRWGARLLLVGFLGMMCVAVHHAWKLRGAQGGLR
jgi:NSS family neurotransmitter:Na+ symporter